MQKKSTKDKDASTEAKKDEIKASEYKIEVGKTTGIESHPEYDPSLPESKQRHLR